MAWKYPRLTRRTFLKSTAYGSTGLALLKPAGLLGKSLAENSENKEETCYSICNFCSSLCNIKVTTHTNNGEKRAVKVDGNPNSTLNRGKICARGQAGLRQTYDTDRLKTPLIRVEGSKRGEYKFRQATWEETWKYIEDKTKSAKIQPWEWTMVGGWTSCVFYMYWAVPFALANGVPNIIASPMQHCVTTGHLGTDGVTGNFNIHDEILPDYDNARYMLFIGNNSSIGAVSTCRMVRFATGKKRGAKVVAVDPRCSETAAKADEWIAIRPGTDLDFMLAMLHVMLEEGYYDDGFLRNYTNMPFLVYKDGNGQWQLANDAEGRPRIMDHDGNVRTVPAFTNNNLHDVEDLSFYPELEALEGLELDGRPVVTVLQAQRQEVAFCTPRWASKTTGVPPETIQRIAHEFGTTRPAIVDPGWHGARYGNIMMVRRVQAMIQALTGGIDKPGGWIMSGEFHNKAQKQHPMLVAQSIGKEAHPQGPPLMTLAGLPFLKLVADAVFDGKSFPQHGKPCWAWAFREQEKAAGRDYVYWPAMADTGYKESVEGKLEYNGEPYMSRAVLINAANPVRHYYPETRWKEILAHKNMELVVVVDVLPSDSTLYADVILPNSTYLERDEPILYGNGVNHDLALTTRYAAIDPLYDTQEAPDILLGLTKIISGEQGQGHFMGAIQMLAGLPAESVGKVYAELMKSGHKSPFSAAYRKISFDMSAKAAHTTPEELDRVLRKKGVFTEEKAKDILKHASMPRKLPMPTKTGRIEFFSSLFDGMRQDDAKGPHFSPMAAHIETECREGKSMDEPLAKDEFYFTYGKAPSVSYASTNSNNPVLKAINEFKKDVYIGIWVHSERAAVLGIDNGDRIRVTNIKSGQKADGVAHVTRKIHRDAIFLHSSFGAENPQLTRTVGIGTAINKLIPYEVDPVVAGFRSQEFTIRLTKLTAEGGAA
uniref:Molybdopterin oxidoreductase Fe4S4 domain-containing protein n=1 Tax=Candidatus Kentrum sp. SD TaxID=2126332 RepID=A0A450YLS9_9GAMM|nr:MAG: Molybdopterin oxidoreductase Fe4S4 domain-containing protein [Candidatus Kentron sp. SD]VFK42482.1 MAG: Molybdopterin oxidoreductase Fe4S4 domain-containing protein [Candidatus Kentron sp. SD]VFK78148.1 MAG: Molybdopterin oxidoreductase Fe4S4 domain-containing protein [Candidatus Kentron sp. SD]